MTGSADARNREACPICHSVVGPVCPLVYPETEGLRCHVRCLAEERERNRVLRREDLRPTFLTGRVADR